MATGRTVRQVKHGERLRRSQTSLKPFATPESLLKKNFFNKKPTSKNSNLEAEGYGPYKPVPPPKPLPQHQLQQQQLQQPSGSSGRITPPPYRMPPYPLYNEPSIPGAAGHEVPIVTSSPSNPQNLQTHSSKFPIEREVILSSSDKNSKIPILNDYMKRSKGAIAPDVPPKQMSAWTQGQNHHHHQQQQNQQILTPDQNHVENNASSMYRVSYHQDYYNSQTGLSTGAVPRQSTWQGELAKTPQKQQQPQQYQKVEDYTQAPLQTPGVPTEKEPKNKTITKTYHSIKDIISSKFKSSKDEDKPEESGLNNAARSVEDGVGGDDRIIVKKSIGEQGIYGKPRVDIQHQYNQHVVQQQILAAQQYQGFKNQQMMQSRSQEMLVAPRPEDYYHQTYASSPQRLQPSQRPSYMVMQSPTKDMNEGRSLEDRRAVGEQRSAQQLERDSLRQKTFEARRAASQPQLSYEDEIKNDIPDNRPQPQAIRRGSQGNLMEVIVKTSHLEEKDSDDGGFLQRDTQQTDDTFNKDESKVNVALQGAPRKQLEGEIGKIEGVYNIGQRSKGDGEELRNSRKTGSAASSDYDKERQSSSNADSGRGSAAYSSGRRPGGIDTSNESDNHHHQLHLAGNYRDLKTAAAAGREPEWVDIVETELRHILEPKLHELSLQTTNATNIANSTLSESISSMTPPLPPLSPGEQSSPNITPRNSTRYKHSSLPYGSKPDYDNYKSKGHPGTMANRWHSANTKHRSNKKIDHNSILRSKQIFGLDTADMTSTTTRSIDLESMLDGQSDSDGDISTTDARTIRKQLEGLESMYSEVLKLLGVKKHASRYQPSDPRFSKRRYGSMSSLPSSSVSSRPIRDKRRAHEDRKKVRDMRGINKRFQRLESHVVTLARSVAHLSSEMRTQHLMIQEMENIRGEISALRTQTNMLNVRSQSAARPTNTSKDLPNLANPTRVKKLTKFFGDEPPLLRLFLRKLGYEKYANVFENERIGMVELPYLSEERLQKMGVPLGPRLRIMEEAQISVCKDTTLCIV
ncbi:PREDICTED: uncharacterized protein LOC108569828 isoform X2 [Nicrophorus vespilloides]|uniref:Uncharacterized protein LOC108569828 isoform X2 n=1 Tax=Nicrophorus vespilloides TaxID=110193 RepID=A0ABM1NJM0_NICVS|nr:PREDICTED: uncharacterized protein LOC108569828 isoform X2 [Nicrophorus vespilloides]